MKLTPTIAERIVTSIGKTNLPMSSIADNCEITYQTLRNWLRNGEEHLQQLEEGKIKKSDLTTNQKKQLDLYQRVKVARTNVEAGYMDKILEIAEEKRDIKAYQWLLKILNPRYRDNHIDEEEAESKSATEVVVVHLNDCGSKDSILLTEFLNGTVNNGKAIHGGTDGTPVREKS